MANKTVEPIIENLLDDYVGKEYHDIDRREWFKVDKIKGDWVDLSSPSGRRFMKMDEFKKMIDRSPLNKSKTFDFVNKGRR